MSSNLFTIVSNEMKEKLTGNDTDEPRTLKRKESCCSDAEDLVAHTFDKHQSSKYKRND